MRLSETLPILGTDEATVKTVKRNGRAAGFSGNGGGWILAGKIRRQGWRSLTAWAIDVVMREYRCGRLGKNYVAIMNGSHRPTLSRTDRTECAIGLLCPITPMWRD